LLWSDPDDPPGPTRLARPLPPFPQRDLDNYIGQFELTCQFLNRMQEHDRESVDFGGLHEGEADRWNIVETDNTQEAIRVWCEYAVFFEDNETYRENIDAAWTYCDSFPAWEEDQGNAEALYYAIHNCGWGLIAEMRFREVYDDSRREYGLRCADHLVEHTPQIEPDMEDRIMPLTAGWAAGTLYEFGLLEDDREYIEAALRIADDVKEWIDADPDRLNRNEAWALCGGTAIWGVLRSLGRADSTETAQWAEMRLERMDVFAGNGQWNNSWNIWYAHAWLAAFQLTGENEYQTNAITIVDSLVAQDTDRDGGIPPTIGNPQDESWVSAYTAWMGLSNLFDALPPVDVSMVRLIEPNINRQCPIRSPIQFVMELVNGGRLEELEIPVRLTGPFETEAIIDVAGWQPVQWVLDQNDIWVPQEPGEYHFTAFTDHENDADRSNDSLYFSLNILPVGNISLTTTSDEGSPVHSAFYFYNLDLDPETVYTVFTTDSANGQADEELMIGNYRVEIIPDYPYPYSCREQFQVSDEHDNTINLQLSQPHVLLVDRDTDSTHADYYTDALNNEGFTYYRWSSSNQGIISDKTDGFETVIYFTGDRINETITPDDQEELRRNLQNGRNLFITGQYIAGNLSEEPFLSNVLRSRFLEDTIGTPMVEGVDGDQVLDGKDMLLLGHRGANNQRGRSGIRAIENGIVCAAYRDRPDTAAAVHWEEPNGACGMFFAFGFEGISGMSGVSREEILSAVLDWMNTTRHVTPGENDKAIPSTMRIIAAYPNPTNGAINIQYTPVLGSGYTFEVTNNLGRRVALFPALSNGIGIWDGLDFNGRAVPSGRYYLMLRDGRSVGLGGGVSVVMLR